MENCFHQCSKLASVTLKCNYPGNKAFRLFYECKNLTTGSIKVPAGQLRKYKANAQRMHAQPGWFAAE